MTTLYLTHSDFIEDTRLSSRDLRRLMRHAILLLRLTLRPGALSHTYLHTAETRRAHICHPL